jgi:hypothetical protein
MEGVGLDKKERESNLAGDNTGKGWGTLISADN